MLSLKLHETDISVTEDQGDSELLLTFEQSQKQGKTMIDLRMSNSHTLSSS